jgi:hypothetical protein
VCGAASLHIEATFIFEQLRKHPGRSNMFDVWQKGLMQQV